MSTKPKSLVVEKIGGSASASPAQIAANVARFAKRKGGFVLVVSGPGGKSGRLTDELITLTELAAAGHDTTKQLGLIEKQLTGLGAELGVPDVANTSLSNIRYGLAKNYDSSWVIRQGDEFAALLYSDLLKAANVPAEYIDIHNAVLLDRFEKIDTERSYKKLTRLINPKGITVVSGHPGISIDGKMADAKLRRGYTDTTGMLIAAAFDNAGYHVTYELSKDDVEGVLRAHPGVVPKAGIIPTITIAELETMSISGAQVVKDEVAGLLEGTAVKLRVFNPLSQSPGTLVVNKRPVAASEMVVGIANKEVIEIKLNQRNIDDQPGAIADFASVFKELKISIKEAVTTSDSVTFYISSNVYRYRADDFKKAIKLLGHDAIVTYTKRNMVVLVGEALRNNHKTLAVITRITSGAQKGKTNLKIVSFWNNDKEPSIYLVVPESSASDFIRMLYRQFF